MVPLLRLCSTAHNKIEHNHEWNELARIHTKTKPTGYQTVYQTCRDTHTRTQRQLISLLSTKVRACVSSSFVCIFLFHTHACTLCRFTSGAVLREGKVRSPPTPITLYACDDAVCSLSFYFDPANTRAQRMHANTSNFTPTSARIVLEESQLENWCVWEDGSSIHTSCNMRPCQLQSVFLNRFCLIQFQK